MFSENWRLINTPPSKTVALVSVGGTVVWPVVALATLEAVPVPLVLMAETR